MLPLPAQLFAPDLAVASRLRLNVVGAVYGAKLEWSERNGGQEPPAEVVRSPNACPHIVDKLDQAGKVAPCGN